MAVYKRTYRAYTGSLTHPTWRFWVLSRYAIRDVFKSRLLLIGYIGCFIVPIIAICAVYLNQNATLLSQVGQKPNILKINENWFANFLIVQGILAGLVTAFVGPSLIAPDLTNGALPLYLSRPMSRWEYILGKGMVLGSLIGSITVLPSLLLFTIQASLVGWTWFVDNLFIANAIIWSCLLLIGVLILLGLAMSAWVRWRIVAGALVLAVFAVGKGFGAVVNAAMRTESGYYLDLQHLISTVAAHLFRTVAADEPVSLVSAWIAIVAFCAVLLALIDRKLRVCEAAG